MIVGLVQTVRQPPLLGPFAEPRDAAARGADRHPGDRLTLAAMVAGVWEGLRADRTTACPVCRGVMEPRRGAGADAVAGSCRDCGTTLS